MTDSQILSSFHPDPPAPPAVAAESGSVFDACHVGLVLRAILAVEAAAAVAALYPASGVLDWLMLLALLSGLLMPAVAAWLLVLCALKRVVAPWPLRAQLGLGVALGGLAGMMACALFGLLATSAMPLPWLATTATGMLAALVLLGAQVLRARARMPADQAARLADLQSRIRPHFLFNTLNSAIALVRAEPAKAERILEDLSDLFRHALADPRAVSTLGEEVLLAQRYLDIEQIRFGARLNLRWSLDPAVARVPVPPLVLQPLVENAVRHGIEPSPTGGWVQVSTARRGDSVVVQVDNSVAEGQPENKGHGIGLRNVRDRLGLMHDIQSDFRAARRGGVFQVRIVLPHARGAGGFAA